jgi:hypothetical protein
MEFDMKTLVTKIVLATSVALGTLVAAGAAYAQPPRYHAAPEVYTRRGIPDTDSVRVSPRSPVT